MFAGHGSFAVVGEDVDVFVQPKSSIYGLNGVKSKRLVFGFLDSIILHFFVCISVAIALVYDRVRIFFGTKRLHYIHEVV